MGAFAPDSDRLDGPFPADDLDPAGRSPCPFRLGRWTVEPSLNQLAFDGNVVRVEPKLMDVLTELAAHAGQVVPKEQLIRAVWDREYLAGSVLTRAVAELRRLLEDDAHAPRYIETIPKRGYRLIAPVAPLGENDGDGAPPRARSSSWLIAAGFALGAALGWLSVRGRSRRAGGPE